MPAIWTSALNFGLVNIRVTLASAVRGAERASFRMLHKVDLTPIEYERVCPRDEKVVPWDEIVKGYEYDKGKFVVVTAMDFARITKLTDEDGGGERPEQTKVVDLVARLRESLATTRRGSGRPGKSPGRRR